MCTLRVSGERGVAGRDAGAEECHSSVHEVHEGGVDEDREFAAPGEIQAGQEVATELWDMANACKLYVSVCRDLSSVFRMEKRSP